MSGGAAKNEPTLAVWRASLKRASDELQARGASEGRKMRSAGKGQSPRFTVSRKQLTDLAREYYNREARSQGWAPAAPKRASPHGLSKRDLHRPVTRSEAIKLCLEG